MEAEGHGDERLPIANIAKVMRGALDSRLKVSREAKFLMEECVTEFICFISSEAAEKCRQERRKTVNAADILEVMKQLGFDNYVYILQAYLFKYRQAATALDEQVRAALR